MADKIAAKAIREGHQVVNSTSRMTYMNKDYGQLPLSKSYSFEPVFAGLKPKEQKNVIGLGCQVWTDGAGRKTRILRISRGVCRGMRRFWMP